MCWDQVSFLDVCDIQGGTQPPKDEWISDAREGYVRMLQIRDFTQPGRAKIEYVKDSSKLKKCDNEDILIGRYGASVGKILHGLSGAYNVAIAKCILDHDRIDRDYLLMWLQSSHFQNSIQNFGGRAAQAGFNKNDLGELQIPLPPLEEQKRIAGILDAADILRAKRREALSKLDDLLQSTFLDLFGDPVTNPKGWEKLLEDRSIGWERCTLGDQITLQRGKDITKKSAKPGKIPVISSGGVSFFHDKAFVSGPGVLLGRKGSVGKVHFSNVDYWPHDTTLFVKDFKGNLPRFVYFFFKQFPISHYEASAANPSLNRNNLHPVKVLWPPLDLQQRFATIVESVEEQKAKMRKHLEQLDDLFASLQQRAFRGDL
jgi:type I restriction enzyme S subunit